MLGFFTHARLHALGDDIRRLPMPRYWLYASTGTAAILAGAAIALPEFVYLPLKPSLPDLAKIALIAFFIPALCEELVFRGLLNLPQSALSIAVSTIAFVAWHPLEAWLFLHEARPYFFDARFLILVGIFGVFSALLRKFSRSMWPSVVSHWILVVAWKALGGARFIV